jgi:DUF4097 and DUF4098 domain-containing protein YvlB
MARAIRRALPLVVCALTICAPAWSDYRAEHQFKLTPGGTFSLESDVGSVRVTGSDRSDIRLVITSTRDDFESRYRLDIDESADRVGVRVDRRGSGWFSWSGNVRFEIEVPRETVLDLGTAGGSIEAAGIRARTDLGTSGGKIVAREIGGELSADTSGGGITIENVDGDVHADTSGGGIRIAGVRGSVHADTSGGGIEIDGVEGDVEAETSGGPIRIDGAGGRVHAETSGGGIRVSFAPGNDRGGSLSTSGGGITVRVDEAVGLDLDAECSGGGVTLDLPVTVQGKIERSSVRGKLGSGGESLRLRTSGGSIRVEPL